MTTITMTVTTPPPMYMTVSSICLQAHAATITIAATLDAAHLRQHPVDATSACAPRTLNIPTGSTAAAHSARRRVGDPAPYADGQTCAMAGGQQSWLRGVLIRRQPARCRQ